MDTASIWSSCVPDGNEQASLMNSWFHAPRTRKSLLCVTLLINASQDESRLLGILDAPPEASIDVHIALFVERDPKRRRVVRGCGIGQREIVAATPAETFRSIGNDVPEPFTLE